MNTTDPIADLLLHLDRVAASGSGALLRRCYGEAGAVLVEEVRRLRAELAIASALSPDDILGQRLVNGRASLPDDTPAWVGELLGEAWAAVQVLRADGATKAAQVAMADAAVGRFQSALGGEITGRLAAEAEVQRLQAERAALLAPVGGVDLETSARLVKDREMLSVVAMGDPTAANRRSEVTDRLADMALALLREVARLRDHLTTARRLLPPRYIAADGSILDPERCTPHAPDCVECGRGRAHDEECLGVQETPSEETERLRVDLQDAEHDRDEAQAWVSSLTTERDELLGEVEEARLTLAAEQGRQEGAPSDRWTSDGHNWYGARPDGGMDKIVRWSNLNGDGTVKHCRGWTEVDRFGFEKERGRFDFARAAMLAADAALAPGATL